MRWDLLFADLEGRFDAAEQAFTEGDVADLTRAERGRLEAVDRLRPHVGQPLTWSLGADEVPITGELLDVGADWVLIRSQACEALLPLSAVHYISGLSRAAEPVTGEVVRRIGVGTVLRGLSRDRAVVTVRLRGDQRLIGTIDRVGRDHLDLAIHDPDLPRRSGAVLDVRCVLIHAMVSVTVR